MKTEGQIYLETGILGGYMPEKVKKRTLGGEKLMPIFSDSVCTIENGRIELRREILVGGRCFQVRSIFNEKASRTATEQMIRVIDGELSKTNREKNKR